MFRLNKKKWSGVLPALALSLCMSGYVQAAGFNVSEIEALLKQGKAEQAYEIALKFRDQLEGEARYDFYYGVAAIDSGHISEGVFALERVVLAFPRDDRARLELARGYYLLNEFSRARQEFERVLDHKPPAAVAANIEKFLNVIRLREASYRSTSSAYVELAMGTDSNINGAPADASFISPIFGALTLSGGSLEESDTYMSITTGGQLNHPFEPGKHLTLGADVSARFHADDNDFETEMWNVYAGVNWLSGEDRFRIMGQVQAFEVADSDNLNLVALNGEWARSLNKATQWVNSAQVAQLGYPGQSSRDSTLYTLSTGIVHTYATEWRPSVGASVFAGYENAHHGFGAARAAAERRFYGVRLKGQIIPLPRLSISGSLSAQNSHFGEENLFVGKTRNENLYQASVDAKWLLDRNISLGAGVSYTRNDSNSVINDYDRTQTRLSVRYDF